MVKEHYKTTIVYDNVLELATLSMLNEYLLDKLSPTFFIDSNDKKKKKKLKRFPVSFIKNFLFNCDH